MSQKVEYERNVLFENLTQTQIKEDFEEIDKTFFEKQEEIIENTKEFDEEYMEEDLEDPLNEKEVFLIEQFDLIVYNALNKNKYLFYENESQSLASYISLDQRSKHLLIKLYLRVKIWAKYDLPKSKLDKILKTGLIKDYNNLFSENEKICDINLLFTFLFNLTVEEQKILKRDLKILTKKFPKSKTKNNYSQILSNCYINNPFFKMFLNDPELLTICKECSKIVTTHNLNENVSISNEAKSKMKYISSYIKAAHLRKIKITSTMTKVFSTLDIMEEITKYLKDNTSSNFEKFFMSQPKSKKEILSEIFKENFGSYITLDETFEKAFDLASKLFFFFTGEFKSVACLNKEMLGFANFEKFENYLANTIMNEENKVYLAPIFSEFTVLRDFYSLYQFKHSIIINIAMIPTYSPIEVLNVNFELFKCSCNFLIKTAINHNKDESLKEYLNSVDMCKALDNNNELNLIKDHIVNLLLDNEGYRNQVKDGFLLKFTPEMLAVEILTVFVQIIEKLNKKSLAILLLSLLLSSGLNYRKRGYYWYRLILLLKQSDKPNFKQAIQIAIKDNHVKSEYRIKISKHSKKAKEGEPETINLSTINSLFFKEVTIKVKTINNGRLSYFNLISEEYTSVEKCAIGYYHVKRGFKGIHGENEALPYLYNILFWDIIYFDKIKYVFQSPYQTYPLDFYSSDFFKNRKEIIENRINEINNFSNEDISHEIKQIYKYKKNIKTIFVKWDSKLITEKVLIELACSFNRSVLSKIFLEFSKNIKFCLEGMPDLFLWKKRGTNYENLIVEVKSTNDKLSDKQKFWINFFTNIGQNVEVLHVDKDN